MLVAIAIAYAELWRSLGVEPDAVVGHSMGEVGAAYIAGVLDLDQAMRIICRRSALMRRTSGKGAMALVELSMDEARARLRGREAQLSVAVSNSPRSSVISGDPDAVQQVMAELERDEVFCRLVKVDVASHSPQMEPLANELAAELAGLATAAARIPIYSTVLARRAEGREFDAAYWARNLRQPVLFDARRARAARQTASTVFVELGPHPVLLPSVEQTAQSAARGGHDHGLRRGATSPSKARSWRRSARCGPAATRSTGPRLMPAARSHSSSTALSMATRASLGRGGKLGRRRPGALPRHQAARTSSPFARRWNRTRRHAGRSFVGA